jgi:hypothetical protein
MRSLLQDADKGMRQLIADALMQVSVGSGWRCWVDLDLS